MTGLHGSLFLVPEESVEVRERGASMWLTLGTVGVHVDDAETAERIACAARDFANRMWSRERAVPIEFLAPDRIPAPDPDGSLSAPVALSQADGDPDWRPAA